MTAQWRLAAMDAAGVDLQAVTAVPLPHSWAGRALAERIVGLGIHAHLPNSVLVTNVAGGHGFYRLGACAHAVVDDFLISLVLPKQGTVRHDRDPMLAGLATTVPVTG